MTMKVFLQTARLTPESPCYLPTAPAVVWAHLQCSFELESKLLKGGYIGCYRELLWGLLRGLLGVRASIEKCS